MKGFQLGDICPQLKELGNNWVEKASKAYATYVAYGRSKNDFAIMVESFKALGVVRTDHRGMLAITTSKIPGIKPRKKVGSVYHYVVHR